MVLERQREFSMPRSREITVVVRTVMFIGTILLSWCVMIETHEIGHIVGGWLCGASLRDWQLWPWQLPYSFFDPDPKPLITLWAGPVLGSIVPLAIALVFRNEWIWLIANFCLLANGLYLALAWLAGGSSLDTQRLLAEGAWPISIVGFCLVTILPAYIGIRANIIYLFSQSIPGMSNDRVEESQV